jgi:ABC-type nitrate/sulfonate/bicarbonate transport system substrate-binding protein
MKLPRALTAIAAFAIAALPCRSLASQVGSTAHVKVLVPDSDNLQYLAFWVAQGAGYFAGEGVEAEVTSPEVPAQAIARMIAGDANVAVLPPPVYLSLIADRFPLELVANLLRNDPINLVVRRSVFEARKMSATAPLRERLLSMQGLRVGVAPGPPTRLRALFASEGLEADRVVKIVVRHGKDQNDAFAQDQCDALYAHTPYVETAIDDQDAVVLVNQSAGDAPPLAMRQIHALVATRSFLQEQRPVVDAMVRALARAETLVHADRDAAEEAVMRAIPSLDRRHLHTIVGLYEPAVPDTPRVSADGLVPALALFPASRKAPSLDGIALGEFVAPQVLEEALARGEPRTLAPATTAPRPATRSWRLALLGLAVLVIAAGGWLLGSALARRQRLTRRAK